MNHYLVAVDIPRSIGMSEIFDILSNCGNISNMKEYYIPNMLYEDEKYDVLLSYNNQEDAIITTNITGSIYRDWKVRIMKLEFYKMYKAQEKLDFNTQESVKSVVSDVVSFFKGVSPNTSNRNQMESTQENKNYKKNLNNSKPISIIQNRQRNEVKQKEYNKKIKKNDITVVINSEGEILKFEKKKKVLPPLPNKLTSDNDKEKH
ncbi:RRM domain-containing protein [Entamoeba marina]